jgi:hypothetical protein
VVPDVIAFGWALVGAGVAIIATQVVSYIRETRQYRAEEERDDAWDAAHGIGRYRGDPS